MLSFVHRGGRSQAKSCIAYLDIGQLVAATGGARGCRKKEGEQQRSALQAAHCNARPKRERERKRRKEEQWTGKRRPTGGEREKGSDELFSLPVSFSLLLPQARERETAVALWPQAARTGADGRGVRCGGVRWQCTSETEGKNA